jgi:hypothetical protein
VIPELEDGHLPPGRYLAALEDVEARFVSHGDFAGSATRAEVWDGFGAYCLEWLKAEEHFGVTLLHALWIGGSFTSGKLDPSDIDVTPHYDHVAVTDLAGQAGAGQVKRLFGHRTAIRERYKVEPFAVPWRRISSTLTPERLDDAFERDALLLRGGLDAWWGRTRPDGWIDDGPPTPPHRYADRGYLEVILHE